MDYYAPSYVGIVMLALGVVTVPVHLSGHREKGMLRRFNASSVPLQSLFAYQAVVSVIITIICIFILIIPSVFIYHISAPHSFLLVILTSILAVAA
jgi:ABC-2 type transport system permease protein